MGAVVVPREAKVQGVPLFLVVTYAYLSFISDVPLPSENRMSIGSLGALVNGAPGGAGNKSNTWGGSQWSGLPNSNASAALGKPAPGRDPKSRAKSREYLKQYVLIRLSMSVSI